MEHGKDLRVGFRRGGTGRWFSLVVLLVAVAACTAAQETRPPSPVPSATISPPAATISGLPGDLGQNPPPARRPYALVTARPTRSPLPGISATSLPTASPTPALTPSNAPDEEGTGYFARTVPAHGSVSVAIDFEGSTWGGIAGYLSGSAVVTFGGKPLKLETSALLTGGSFSFGTSTNDPVNGTLVMKNASSSPLQAAGYVTIRTSRHLNATASTNFPKRGQPVTFDVVLSEPTDSDAVVGASSGRAQTGSVPVAVTKVGLGHWVGTATFDTSGDYEVRFQTTGARWRGAMVALAVAAGGVTVANGFDTQIDDSDRDGYINDLVLSPTVTTLEAGQYLVRGELDDPTGTKVADASTGEQALAAGSHKVALTFGGKSIYKAGRWGPYTLRVTVERIGPTTIEIDGRALGQTEPYDYMQFQHDPIAFDPKSFKAQPFDTDGDGISEELVFAGTVTVEKPGLYVINASLYADKPWEHVAFSSTKVQLSTGANTFKLVFTGADIAKAGRDGPYVEAGLLCYLESDGGNAPLGYTPNFTTPAYTAGQFGP